MIFQDHAGETRVPQGLAKFAARWQFAAMRFVMIAGLFVFAFTHMACAETGTLLQLSATGTVLAVPDQMTASLNVQDIAAIAAAAQAAVNAQMAKALAAAKAVNGVTATTSSYNVYQPDSQKPGYQASQTLNLTIPAPGGVPPDEFTALLGKLQQNGLLLNNMDGQLSPQGQDQAREAATTDALHRLQAEAGAIAAALGDKVGAIKTLNVDTGNSPAPMPRMMMAMASPPPQAAPSPVTIQVTVSATIELTPPTP